MGNRLQQQGGWETGEFSGQAMGGSRFFKIELPRLEQDFGSAQLGEVQLTFDIDRMDREFNSMVGELVADVQLLNNIIEMSTVSATMNDLQQEQEQEQADYVPILIENNKKDVKTQEFEFPQLQAVPFTVGKIITPVVKPQ